eukprot:5174-Heterococcus_DN1.PRE.2
MTAAFDVLNSLTFVATAMASMIVQQQKFLYSILFMIASTHEGCTATACTTLIAVVSCIEGFDQCV